MTTRSIEMTSTIDPGGDDIALSFDKGGVSLTWEISDGKTSSVSLTTDQLDALTAEYEQFKRLQALASEPAQIGRAA